MRYKTVHLVIVTDLIGTALLSAQGAVAAMNSGLDLFGVLAIAFLAALGGGVIRDVLLGDNPPSAIQDWRYPALTIAVGFAAFVFHSSTNSFNGMLATVVDALALSIVAIAGTEKAIDYKIKPFAAILMGGITAVGGGIIRDVILLKIPAVFVTQIYATAALLCAAILLLLRHLGWKPATAAFAAGSICFIVRMLAVWFHWELPRWN